MADVPELPMPQTPDELELLVAKAIEICLTTGENEQTRFIVALMLVIRDQFQEIMRLLGRTPEVDDRLKAAFTEALEETRARDR